MIQYIVNCFIHRDITSKKPTDPKEVFLQKVSSSHNFLEQFLNNVIVKFNFKDSTIFRTVRFLIIKLHVNVCFE